MKIYSSKSTQYGNTMTATEVVQELYRRFPEIDLYDERDKGDTVVLIFDGSVKNNMPLKNYLESTGIDYLIRENTLYITVPEDDDLVIAECDDVFSSHEFFDKGDGAKYWYFTTHGIQPGSVPSGLDILEIRDTAGGSYFLTNKVLTTDALNYYDIKERVPAEESKYRDFSDSVTSAVWVDDIVNSPDSGSSSYDRYILDTFRDRGIDIDQWLDDIYYNSPAGLDDVDVVDILIDRLEMYRDDGAISLPDNYKQLVGTYVYNHYDEYAW